MKVPSEFFEKSRVMKAILLAALLGIAGNASAQSRFSMSANVAPILKSSTFYDNTSPVRQSTTYTGFGIGTNLHFQFSPRWSASSGLWLEWVKSRSTEQSVLNNPHYFKIPLLVNYQLGQKRLSPYFTTGLVLEKFKYSTVVFLDGAGAGNTTIYNVGERAQLKLLLAAGMKYDLNESLSLVVQPTFISNSLHVLNRGYQLNFQTQVICRF